MKITKLIKLCQGNEWDLLIDRTPNGKYLINIMPTVYDSRMNLKFTGKKFKKVVKKAVNFLKLNQVEALKDIQVED